MCKENTETQWLSLDTSKHVIKVLVIARRIIELEEENKGCNQCKLLTIISDITKSLGMTSKNGCICLSTINGILLSFDNICKQKTADDICSKVCELLKEIFIQYSNAEEVAKRLENILKQLDIKLEREGSECE